MDHLKVNRGQVLVLQEQSAQLLHVHVEGAVLHLGAVAELNVADVNFAKFQPHKFSLSFF